MENQELQMAPTIKYERFSFSKLDCYEGCHFKFKLKYRDKYNYWNQNIATAIGTLIHETEEDIANCIRDNQPINYTKLKNNIIVKLAELQYKFPTTFNVPDKVGRTYKEKIYEYLDKGIYRLETFLKEHPTYEVVSLEQKFDFDYEGYNLNGSIDRVLRDTATGEYILHDIKTYPKPMDHKDLTTPLQFIVYIIAMNHLFGVDMDKIKCAYDLPFCDIRQDAGTPGFLTRGFKKLKKLIEDINMQEFEPKPSPLCHWCDFCPTNENQPKECKGKVLCPYHSLYTKEAPIHNSIEKWQGLANHQAVVENYINKCKAAL
jgi:hypothetical protein